MDNLWREYTACSACDLIIKLPLLHEGKKGKIVTCPRCQYTLFKLIPNNLDKLTVFAITGIICFFLANISPFIDIQVQGQIKSVTLIENVISIYHLGYPLLAMLVFSFVMLLPLIFLLLMLCIFLPLRFQLKTSLSITKRALVTLFKLKEWSMVEVFIIGVIVSLIKLTSLVNIIIGTSFIAYIVFGLMILLSLQHLDKHQIWSWFDNKQLQ